MNVSIRAYGRHRGVSDTAVHKAIKTGRISKEPDGKINIEKADREWDENTDKSQQRDYVKSPIKKAIGKEQPIEPDKTEQDRGDSVSCGENDESFSEDESSDGMTYAEARTANEILKAQTSELKLQELRGELVNRAKALDHVFKLARAERDAWIGWPSRIAALMAAELEIDAHQMHITLERYVREHLSELSDINPKVN